MVKSGKRDAKQASLVQKTHELTGISRRHIRRVINGEHDNEIVMRVYMFLCEGDNKLVTAARKLVPFD